MTTRADVVREAREWLGTRFHHQAAVKGVGCDCVGLAGGVGLKLGLYQPADLLLPEAQQFKAYGKRPSNGILKRGFDLFADPISINDMQPGDIILMCIETEPQHVAILSDWQGRLGMIHSYAQLKLRKVVEHGIDETWRKRIVCAYQYRGIE